MNDWLCVPLGAYIPRSRLRRLRNLKGCVCRMLSIVRAHVCVATAKDIRLPPRLLPSRKRHKQRKSMIKLATHSRCRGNHLTISVHANDGRILATCVLNLCSCKFIFRHKEFTTTTTTIKLSTMFALHIIEPEDKVAAAGRTLQVDCEYFRAGILSAYPSTSKVELTQ